MKKFSALLVAIFCFAINLTSKGQTTGTTFRDFNGNGTRQNTPGTFVEPVVAGIIVNAYNSSDVLVASYTTSAAGTFTIPLTGSAYNGTPGSNTGSVNTGVAIRLEFIIPATGSCGLNPNFDYSAANGNTYGTSVRFVNGGATGNNYAINDPSQYVSDAAPFTNTYIFQALLAFGDPTASPAGTAAPQKAFVKFPYNRSGTTALSASEILATSSQIGSVYGVAYSKRANKIFTSAFMKRHSGFGPANGTFNNAPGAIYIIDPTKNSTTTAATYFTSLDALGIPTHNTTGTPAYGNGTSYTLSAPVAGTAGINYYDRTEKITYIGNGQTVIGSNVTRGLNKDSSVATNDAAAFENGTSYRTRAPRRHSGGNCTTNISKLAFHAYR